MKYCVNIHPILFAIVMCFFCICHEANSQDQSSTLQDRDGNIYTIKIFPDNKKWMTDNLNINIPESYCYENAEQKCKKYGRLYMWKSAQKGCKLLGEGWRLPTNEEWQRMAKSYGGVRDDSDDGGKAAYLALINAGKAGFNVVYGGRSDSAGVSYARGDSHGFYWAATESDSAHAWFYNFGKNGKIMNRHHDGEKYKAISVRCIRDTGNLKEQ